MPNDRYAGDQGQLGITCSNWHEVLSSVMASLRTFTKNFDSKSHIV